MPSCFFIGHRDAPGELLPHIRVAAEELIVRKGVTDFYVGSRGGFDRLAAAAVLELRAAYPDIRLYRVLAYHPTVRDAPYKAKRACPVWKTRESTTKTLPSNSLAAFTALS